MARHGVSGFVRQAVARDTVAVPPFVAEGLRSAALAQIAHVARLDAALAKILPALDAAAVPTIVLKGPVPSRPVYPDPTLRPYSDIDLNVREPDELRVVETLLAAGLVEVPHVAALLSEPLQRLRATFGLSGGSIPSLMEHYLVLTPFPLSLNTAGDPIAATAQHIRAIPLDSTDTELPTWIDVIGSWPLNYVSLGTVARGARSVEILSKWLAGLHAIEAEVVVTVGHHLDLAALGPQPSHIHLERFLPLGALLPRCSLVLFHGGSGTLGRTVAHGLQMVILPISADQPGNAARCAELGAA